VPVALSSLVVPLVEQCIERFEHQGLVRLLGCYRTLGRGGNVRPYNISHAVLAVPWVNRRPPRAPLLCWRAVQKQAYVLAYIDGFMVLGFAAIGVLLLMLPAARPAYSNVLTKGANMPICVYIHIRGEHCADLIKRVSHERTYSCFC
jgi:hypothetical protein